jgi:hypothetical protein
VHRYAFVCATRFPLQFSCLQTSADILCFPLGDSRAALCRRLTAAVKSPPAAPTALPAGRPHLRYLLGFAGRSPWTPASDSWMSVLALWGDDVSRVTASGKKNQSHCNYTPIFPGTYHRPRAYRAAGTTSCWLACIIRSVVSLHTRCPKANLSCANYGQHGTSKRQSAAELHL